MEFIIENYVQYKFYVCLLNKIDNSKIKTIEENDNVVILNPDYIVSTYQILLSINRSLHNFFTLKKYKTNSLKKEILYYSSEKGKFDSCQKIHKVIDTCYIIFINTTTEEINKIKGEVGGEEISPSNFSKFINYEALKKEFEISEEEINNNESGIMGAVYNRIATKDFK